LGWQPNGPGRDAITPSSQSPVGRRNDVFRRCPTLTTRRWDWHMGDFNRSRPQESQTKKQKSSNKS